MSLRSLQKNFEFYALEERVMLDGEGLDEIAAPESMAATGFAESADIADDAGGVDGVKSAEAGESAAILEAPVAADLEDVDDSVRREVVFVDSTMPDYESLLDDVRNREDPGRQLDVVLLDSGRDGIEQMAEVLATYAAGTVDAVHLVSHGIDSGLRLGNMRLSVDNVELYAEEFTVWQQAFSSDADLFVYGCDLAAGDAGIQLLQSLGEYTGADVAASTDATGAEELGGDWVLEYTSGQLETEVAFSAELRQSWIHLAANTAPVMVPDGDSYNTIEGGVPATSMVSVLLGYTVSDADYGAVEGIAIYSIAGGGGVFQYSTDGGATWTACGSVSVTSALLLRESDWIRFAPDAANGGTMTVDYFAWDQTSGAAGTKVDASTTGGTSAFSTASDRLTINTTSVNDAPALDNSGSMSLTPITEDDAANGGNTVASIIASAGGDRITDVDSGALEGIAVTGLNSGNGTWQYSTDGGSTWASMGTVSTSSALLLRGSDLVRFVPGGQVAGSPDISFCAWDQTSGSAGTKVSTTTNGGTTAFSSATETATILVSNVNDEQVLATNDGLSINENSTGNAIGTAQLQTTDVDNAASALVYTITAATANGTLRRAGTSLGVGDTITQADIDSGLVTYDHNGSETSSDSFSFSVDDGAGATSTGTFNIAISAVNDNAPVISSDGGTATVAFNRAENSTAVTTVTSIDADLPAQTITYSIIGGADVTLFAVHSTTGVLTFISSQDFENHADSDLDGVYEVIVQASDGLYTDSQSISVSITDVDEYDVSAVVDADGATDEVAENAANGTAVGITAIAQDLDGTTNSVSYSLFDDAGGRFTIDSTTGQVTVANGSLLDREAAATHNITVRASSADGSIADTVFTISLLDEDEADITALSDMDAAANVVGEQATIGTQVGITALAQDADATDNVTYSLDDDAAGLFAIDGSTGIVTVAAALDYESATNHDITVRATSDDGSSTTRVMNIVVTDDNEFDVSAISDTDPSAASVSESAATGTLVGITAFAKDDDATNNGILYSLDDDAGGRFAIDANTGVVTVADGSLLDYEAASSHDIVIRVTSQDGSNATQTITISIADENDNAPVIAGGQSFLVAENLPAATSVGFVAASDVDGSGSIQNWQIVSDSSGGAFTIDAVTGEVTTAASFDYESTSSFTLVIRVDDGVNDSADQSITINIGNVNEAPIGSADSYTIRTDQILSVTMPGLLTNDFDVESDALFPVLVAGPSQGVLTLNADGSFSYDPNAGFFGNDTFQYQVSDGALLSNVVTVTVRVDAVASSTPAPPTTPPPPAAPTPAPASPADSDDGDKNDNSDDLKDTAAQVGAAVSLGIINGAAGNADQAAPSASAQGQIGQNASTGSDGDSQGISDDALAASLRGTTGRSDGDRRYLDAAAMMSPVEVVLTQRMLQADLEQAIVWSEWDKLREGGGGGGIFGDFTVGTAGATAGLVSVGYVMWALRGGVFLATAYSSLPAWRMLDPATLLISYRTKKADGADDSLERLLGG